MLALVILSLLNTPEEDVLKILSRRWSGDGGLANVDIEGKTSFAYEYNLKCDAKAYCCFLALRCTSKASESGPSAEGEFLTEDKRGVFWKCTSLDGATGKVAIGRRTFALAAGGLFILVPREKEIEVIQVAADLTKVKKLSALGLAREQARNQPVLRKTLQEFGVMK